MNPKSVLGLAISELLRFESFASDRRDGEGSFTCREEGNLNEDDDVDDFKLGSEDAVL